MNAGIVYKSENFTVVTHQHPHVTRADGGHIVIGPNVPVVDRACLTPRQAVELMKLTMVAGEAMKTVLNGHGVDVARIN